MSFELAVYLYLGVAWTGLYWGWWKRLGAWLRKITHMSKWTIQFIGSSIVVVGVLIYVIIYL